MTLTTTHHDHRQIGAKYKVGPGDNGGPFCIQVLYFYDNFTFMIHLLVTISRYGYVPVYLFIIDARQKPEFKFK